MESVSILLSCFLKMSTIATVYRRKPNALLIFLSRNLIINAQDFIYPALLRTKGFYVNKIYITTGSFTTKSTNFNVLLGNLFK